MSLATRTHIFTLIRQWNQGFLSDSELRRGIYNVYLEVTQCPSS